MSSQNDRRRPRGRPREHPEGLSEPLSVKLSQSAYDRLARQAIERKTTVAKLARQKLSA